MARSARPRPAGKRRPHGTILGSPGRRFTLEVTATIQQARAWRLITKAGHPRVMPPEGTLITPEQSAAVLIAHLSGDDTGAIWDVSTARARS
jgi:hypothetical protein